MRSIKETVMFHIHSKFARTQALPPLHFTGNLPQPLADGILRAVREETALGGRHNLQNAFHAGEISKFGQPERRELVRIDVSLEPFPDLEADLTRMATPGGDTVHVAFVDSRDVAYPWSRCQSMAPDVLYRGTLVANRLGQVWLLGYEEDAGPENAFLVRVRADATPSLTLRGDERPLIERLPANGLFRISSGGWVADAPEGWTAPDPANPGWLALQDHIEKDAEQQAAMAAIVDRVLTDEKLEALAIGRTFPIEGGLIPKYQDSENAPRFREAEDALARELMEAFRQAGVLAACPNNGPRGVRGLAAWNDWLAGRYDRPAEERAWEERWSERFLDDAPAFKVFGMTLTRATVDLEDDIRERLNHGAERNFNAPPPLLARDDFEAFKARFRQDLTEIFMADEDINRSLMGSDALRGSLNDDRFSLQGSLMRPVLCAQTRLGATPVPLPPLDKPKVARHLELSLPSGVLVMADWLRIPGFTEAIERFCDGDRFEISHAKGLDDRAQAYFERLGLAIVQVGNTSPSAYADTPGVWRMGHVDEDHEDFRVKKKRGARRFNLDLPKPAWETCTDHWANIFADREVILDILMASGLYADRVAAGTALEDYSKECWTTAIVDLGVDRLHLYLPTGAADRDGSFEKDFRVAELAYPDWRNDAYVLSAKPLTVDPAIMEECNWVEGRIRSEDMLSAPRSEAPAP
ncbi:hypothetical protein LAZ40_11015 [Cereibacter sphaeroides]|uniref:hypothetical protein n=1 Tax=Cereibacter sphaeroides TaxID=1063 RepID=UPI001F18405B|nr:hypothetical protein [Cereibacter sphaeroides]MCE6959586.1 hypothetical protein [Cereibacter sphaeroides]MCE6974554.1 hypothetical protein [Cereibacter sphaeroides]